MRPSNASEVIVGSQRHSPAVPSISTGIPAAPTSLGRATPSARRRRSSRIRWASARATISTPGGYTRSATSQSRCRPRRPATATWPLAVRISSSWVTLRSFVHPVDAQGSSALSGISEDSSGPAAASWSSTRRRNPSFAASHLAAPGRRVGQVAMSARYSPRFAMGRTIATPGALGGSWLVCSNSVRSRSRACWSSSGAAVWPRRLHATRSAFGATTAVGSSCTNVSRSTIVSRSVGRSASSSWARTAIRRAS